MDWVKLTRSVVPPLCAGCRGQCSNGTLICEDCLWDLDAAGPVRGDPPPGIDRIVSVAPHQEIGRDLLTAYKFRGLFGLGEFLAARMADLTSDHGRPPSVVPVPAARMRSRRRGFDPAGDLAKRLAAHRGWPFEDHRMIRVGGGRQRGQGRSARLGSPPEIRVTAPPSPILLLVDDVVTTGATLAACARALRSAGAAGIEAVTFTRRV